MTQDFTPDPAPQIVVAASPAVPQLAAGIRQAALALGVILTTLGLTTLADKAGLAAQLAPQIATLVVLVGPVLAAGAAWLGQVATRRHAQQALVMASKLDDKDAVVK